MISNRQQELPGDIPLNHPCTTIIKIALAIVAGNGAPSLDPDSSSRIAVRGRRAGRYNSVTGTCSLTVWNGDCIIWLSIFYGGSVSILSGSVDRDQVSAANS